MKAIPEVSLVIAALTAIWFGVVAQLNRRNIISAAVTGGLLGLIVSGICLGLGNAVTIPYTHLVRSTAVVRAAGVALGIVGLIGAIFMTAAHRNSERLN